MCDECDGGLVWGLAGKSLQEIEGLEFSAVDASNKKSA